MRSTAIALCLMVAACAEQGRAPVQIAMPAVPSSDSAAAQATRDCAGPWKEWSRTTATSEWPYRIQITETMRYLKDGRVVGPFTYRGDDL